MECFAIDYYSNATFKILVIILIVLSDIQNNRLVLAANGSISAMENEYGGTTESNYFATPTPNDTNNMEYQRDIPDPNITYDNSSEEDGSFGSLPSDPNVDHSNQPDVTMAETTPDKDEIFTCDEVALAKTLLNGSSEEVQQLPRSLILKSLPAINKIHISLNKRLLIWTIIKDNRSVKTLKRPDLEKTGQLLLIIPEIDLYNLNYSDWDVVDYLGTFPGLSRRQAGIIGYAIKQEWGSDIICRVDYINHIKGILCAFSPQELVTITPTDFCKIDDKVFQNIRSCTSRQLQVLVHTAKLSTVFGPTQAWNMTITARLGLLIKALGNEDLRSIRPEAMEGISSETIEAMPRETLEIFDEDQISCLDDRSLAAYRRITGIDSNKGYNQKAAQISKFLIYEVILLCCIAKFMLHT